MPKYKIETKEKEKNSFDTFAEMNRYKESYLEKNVHIDKSVRTHMVENILNGKKIFKDIEVDRKTVLLKIYCGNKLMDTITEREAYIDRFISTIHSNKKLKDIGMEPPLVDMSFDCILKSSDYLEQYTFNDVRNALFMYTIGLISNVSAGVVSTKVIEAEADSSGEEMYHPEKTVKKSDVDRMYR